MTARRSNQSILREINPEYSLEGLMMKLKLQNFDHLMQRANSLKMNLILGNIESKRRKGWQRTRWLDGISESMEMNVSKFQEIVKDGKSLACYSSWGHKESDTTEQLNSTELILLYTTESGQSWQEVISQFQLCFQHYLTHCV